jgi:hypothetical protein
MDITVLWGVTQRGLVDTVVTNVFKVHLHGVTSHAAVISSCLCLTVDTGSTEFVPEIGVATECSPYGPSDLN